MAIPAIEAGEARRPDLGDSPSPPELGPDGTGAPSAGGPALRVVAAGEICTGSATSPESDLGTYMGAHPEIDAGSRVGFEDIRAGRTRYIGPTRARAWLNMMQSRDSAADSASKEQA